MAHFDKASGAVQAVKAMSLIDKTRDADGNCPVRSCGTHRNVEQVLKNYAEWIKDNRLGDLRHSTPKSAESYLLERAEEVQQKTLDQIRQGIEIYQHVTGALPTDQHLPIIQSQIESKLEHRAYTPEQVQAIMAHQTPANALATELAYYAGLRAHELITIRPIAEQQPDDRSGQKDISEYKFAGREGVHYTVVGKGGLCREVVLSKELADRLEEHRLAQPVEVVDRQVKYQCYYAIGHGNAFSKSFSDASKRALGWSTGAHGLRHSYVQERMKELQSRCDYETAKLTLSNEVGHFRFQITTTYLR